ncbi:class I SAM-dependent methyltransferase [Roseibium algae]|uniref:Methyltransferase domain-containing protein n=1 Tax=Roseibium algae TaxID=3123038 RepID=A0ABU8TMW4_9HYPH
MSQSNYSLRDDIKDYWSFRSETFDLQPGHEIFSERERHAWHELITDQLGPANGRATLDLACGTAVVSHLMYDLGFRVTGLDWSDAMLDKARAKSRTRGSNIRFLRGDAEATREPEASYDVIVMRHLVWTLVDPPAAIAHWLSLLKPGGVILIVDGDFVTKTRIQRLITWVQRRILPKGAEPIAPATGQWHERILSQVYFNKGARSEEVAGLLESAGFVDVTVQSDLRSIWRSQANALGPLKALQRRSQHRYAIRAHKDPVS